MKKKNLNMKFKFNENKSENNEETAKFVRNLLKINFKNNFKLNQTKRSKLVQLIYCTISENHI